MSQKLLFIVNPYSGKGRIGFKLLDVVDLFTKHGYDVTVYPTQSQGDGETVARRAAADYDLVVCSGGDGTLNEVVNGYMENGGTMPPLGYIPSGTTNDFAKTLRIPGNIIEAASVAVTGKPVACDVGRFNDRYFIYSAAFGAFSDVPYITPKSSKTLLGHAAYVLQGIERLSYLKSYNLDVTAGEQHISGEFIFGMVTNSESIGGFKRLSGMNVSLNDGLFETLLIKMPNSVPALQGIARAILAHKMDSPGIYAFRSNELRIRSEEAVAWTLDGEYGGTAREMKIDTVHKAIRYIVR